MAPAGRGRLIALYSVMAVLVTIVFVAVIADGEDREPQPSIAGGYDVIGENACLGAKFDVRQSGQFVNLVNTKGTLGGKLEFDEGELTGDVDCVGGESVEMDADVADGVMRGTLDSEEFEAELKRDVPAAGTPKPRSPDSLAAENYKLTPRSACLGAKIAIEGDDPFEVVAKGKTVGELEYDDGAVTGEVTCSDGEKRPVYGDALDRPQPAAARRGAARRRGIATDRHRAGDR
jgi:hypothetical protein